MPTPQTNQFATVIVDGYNYTYWTSVRVERIFGEVVSTATLECAEVDLANFKTIQLMVGQQGTVLLAGQLAITGLIGVRQVAYNKGTHSVQIEILCNTISLLISTVDPKIDGQGGQFLNQTFQQIAQAIGVPVGIAIQVIGAPGSQIPFDRVSVTPAEKRIDFLWKLAAQRNLHAVDSPDGTLTWQQAGQNASGFVLLEGGNILSARAMMRNDQAVREVKLEGSGPGTDENNGPVTAQVLATATDPAYSGGPRPFTLMAEHTTSQQEAQLRANFELAQINLTEFTAEITVQGWLSPNGDIWLNYIGSTISLVSPMIFPQAATLAIKGVRSSQDNEGGTVTVLILCLPIGLGGSGTVNLETGASQ